MKAYTVTVHFEGEIVYIEHADSNKEAEQYAVRELLNSLHTADTFWMIEDLDSHAYAHERDERELQNG